LVHLGVVAHHIVREVANFLVLGFRQRLLRGLDVELPRGIGNMRDLRIGRFGRALREGGRG
jgi:hypothetical protein